MVRNLNKSNKDKQFMQELNMKMMDIPDPMQLEDIVNGNI